MAEGKNLDFGFGGLTFHSARDATPDRTEVQGNVTINNKGTPARPAHYIANFNINFDAAADTLIARNNLFLSVVVEGANHDAPYSEVERLAADQLAPLLRQVADMVEAAVGETGGGGTKEE